MVAAILKYWNYEISLKDFGVFKYNEDSVKTVRRHHNGKESITLVNATS